MPRRYTTAVDIWPPYTAAEALAIEQALDAREPTPERPDPPAMPDDNEEPTDDDPTPSHTPDAVCAGV